MFLFCHSLGADKDGYGGRLARTRSLPSLRRWSDPSILGCKAEAFDALKIGDTVEAHSLKHDALNGKQGKVTGFQANRVKVQFAIGERAVRPGSVKLVETYTAKEYDARKISSPHGQSKAPPGCSERTLNSLLLKIRDGLDFVSYGRLKHSHSEMPRLVESIRSATEWLVWGERHDAFFFDLFCEHMILTAFITALCGSCTPKMVKLQVLQSLSILVQNVRRKTSLIYLLSGGLLSTFFDDPPDFEDEEMMAYFVTLLKGLALRLDDETALLCLTTNRPPVVPASASASETGSETMTMEEFLADAGISSGGSRNQSMDASRPALRMPVFECSIRLVDHKDIMVQAAARTAVLSILRLEDTTVRPVAEAAAAEHLAPRLKQLSVAASGDCLEEIASFVSDLGDIRLAKVDAAMARHGCQQGLCMRESR